MRHFKAYEVVWRAAYEEMHEGALTLIHPVALIMLDDARDFFGVPITCNTWYWGGASQWSGARTLAKAIELGSEISMHITEPEKRILCRAFDLQIKGYSPEQARQKILDNKYSALLQNITRMEALVPWLHIDCKPLPAGEERIVLFSKKKGIV